MTTKHCPYTEGALWTWVQKTSVRCKWREGRGPDRQDVYLLNGPWGVRVLDAWGVHWAAYTIPETEVGSVEAALKRLHRKEMLFNAGATMDADWLVMTTRMKRPLPNPPEQR